MYQIGKDKLRYTFSVSDTYRFLYGAFFFMKQVPLTKGYFALVDDCDFEELMKYRWFVDVRPTGIYIKRHRPDRLGGNGNIYMHRQIMGITDRKFVVDHRDGNPLNNQRENLRVCTHSQNGMNSNRTKGAKFGFKGVLLRPSGRYGAQLMFQRKHICIGTFDTLEAAARAYDLKAKELFGEFANLNFPAE
jgi:DUF971 family protein